jgi:hypothetical protein
METIHDICKKYEIKKYTINPDGSIDVNDNVFLDNKRLTQLPLRFNKVTGSFDCASNRLTSLKGCPVWVGVNFICSYNNLTSLEFSPDYVGDYFNCVQNYLTSLEFSPDYVGWSFNCNWNRLTDNYCDTEIGGSFYTTLEQDGLTKYNYNEWRKLYKRKKILDDIFKIGI